MKRKRILFMLVVLAVLCLLVYLQVRTWRQFDWKTFGEQTKHVRWLGIFLCLALTYAAYALRAIRWKIFLKPVCNTTTARLMAPQLIGFTALALLGRAGEVVRPYIIAKKENLTFASQVAVWTVERIFDMGAFAVILAFGFLSPEVATLPHYHEFREAAFGLVALAFFLLVFAVVIRKAGERVGDSLQRLFSGFAPGIGHRMRNTLQVFSLGLRTIDGVESAVQIIAVSLFMWVLIAFSYMALLHSYPEPLRSLSWPKIVLLMLSSTVGSMIQLPAVGGGSQLATISVLTAFDVKPELAVSCGMLLWAVTFMAVIPVGLLLARREHVSLRSVKEAEEEEQEVLAE
jgi:uncharacterized protein (TIRG00374 family)